MMRLNRRALLIAIGVAAVLQVTLTLLGYALSTVLPQDFLVNTRSLAVAAVFALVGLTLTAGIDAFGGALYAWLRAHQSSIPIQLGALGGALVGAASRLVSELVSFSFNLLILVVFAPHVSPTEGQGADLWLLSLLSSIWALFWSPFLGLLFGGLGGAIAGLVLGRSSSAHRTRRPA